MSSSIVEIDLGQRSYDIIIGENLLNKDNLLPSIHGHQVMLVTNETVAPLLLDKVKQALSDKQVFEVVLPDGEQYKNAQTLDQIFTSLLEVPCDRKVTLIALGGGVVGDITGFAAACYQRGVPFIQIPTTLLAQVDSSVGGKTAINHPLGKNMIGAFYQPQRVLADLSVLKTLPPREFSAGLAEVVKYGLIVDADFFSWLEQNAQALMRQDIDALVHAITVSCQTKAYVVEKDETEQGMRALLNLGHTFGHAIEAGLGYGVWLHGEAVGLGMLMAARMSQKMGAIDADDVARIKDLLKQMGLPTAKIPRLDIETMLTLMARDKKVSDSKINLILLNDIGKAHITANYPLDMLREIISEFVEN